MLERIPVKVVWTEPMCIVVKRYDEHSLLMTANSNASLEIVTPDGKSHTEEFNGLRQVRIPIP